MAVLVLGVAGFIVILYHTRFGAAVNGDAVQYIAGARSILAGEGFGMPDGSGEIQPLIALAPFFSTALAGVGLIGIDPLEGARYLNAFLYGVNIALAAILVYHHTRSYPAALLVGVWFFTSVTILAVHAFALTEALFITLTLVCFFALSRFADNAKWAWLVASGLAAGLATITRFAGLSLIAAGAASLLLRSVSWGKRIGRALVFGSLGIGPFLLWSWRNVGLSGTATARPVQFMITRTRLALDLGSASAWILPDAIDRRVRILIFVGLILLVAAVILYMGRNVLRNADVPKSTRWFVVFLGVYILAYLLVMVGSMAFLDVTMRITHRYLSPAIIATMLLIGILIYWVVFAQPTSRQVRNGAMLGVGVFLAINTLRFVQYVQDPGITFGYTDARFSSDTIAAISELDQSIPIITDQREKVYILTGRTPYSVPHGIHQFTQELREDLPDQMIQFRRLLAQGAVFAMFDEYLLSQSPPVAGTLVEGLIILRDTADGALYVNPEAWSVVPAGN